MLRDGQLDAEFRAGLAVGNAQASAHVFHNPIAHREPQPGTHAYRFGGKERLENPLQQTRVYPAGVVFDPDAYMAAVVLAVQGNPGAQGRVFFSLAEQGVAGVDHQVDQYLFQLVDIAFDLYREVGRADAHVYTFAAQAFAEQGQGALQCLRGVEGLLLDFRAAAEHAHVVDHAGCALHLGVDALEFFREVVDLHIAIAQALEHIGDGHAHHVQRLVDFMGQAGGHFAEGGHFCALGQLLLGAAHFGVVAAHGLHFDQGALFIEDAAVRPHPPGMFAPRQLQADFRGAHREFRGQLLDALYKGGALFIRQPLAQVDAWQLLGPAFQVVGQRRVAEGEDQVGAVAADHRGRVFHQDAVAFFALAHLLGGQGRLGDVQPQAYGFHWQAEVVA